MKNNFKKNPLPNLTKKWLSALFPPPPTPKAGKKKKKRMTNPIPLSIKKTFSLRQYASIYHFLRRARIKIGSICMNLYYFWEGGGGGAPPSKKIISKKILTFKWFPSSLVYVCVCREGGEGALWMERGGGGRTTPPGRIKDMTNTF